jgi:hypothetical protein
MLQAKVLAMLVLLAAWDRVPTFNVEPACRYLANRVASSDQMKLCLSHEQARPRTARQGMGHVYSRRQGALRQADDGGRSVLRRFVDVP